MICKTKLRNVILVPELTLEAAYSKKRADAEKQKKKCIQNIAQGIIHSLNFASTRGPFRKKRRFENTKTIKIWRILIPYLLS